MRVYTCGEIVILESCLPFMCMDIGYIKFSIPTHNDRVIEKKGKKKKEWKEGSGSKRGKRVR